MLVQSTKSRKSGLLITHNPQVIPYLPNIYPENHIDSHRIPDGYVYLAPPIEPYHAKPLKNHCYLCMRRHGDASTGADAFCKKEPTLV